MFVNAHSSLHALPIELSINNNFSKTSLQIYSAFVVAGLHKVMELLFQVAMDGYGEKFWRAKKRWVGNIHVTVHRECMQANRGCDS